MNNAARIALDHPYYMLTHDKDEYPDLISLLDARQRLAKTCRYCGLVNAAWGTPAWTQDHPSCKTVYDKRIQSLQALRAKHDRL